MTEIYGIYAILLLISTTVTLYISFFSWNKRLNPNAYYFSLLMAAVSVWSICEAFQMASTSVETKILWSQLSYIGIVFIGPFFLLFTMSYTDNQTYLNKKFAAVIAIVPAFTLILVVTNPIYGWIWPYIIPTSNQPGAILIYGRGVGFYLNIIYNYILLVTGVLLLFQSIIRNPKVFQKQAWMILIATMIPLFANLIYLTEYSPVMGLDPTPFAFTLSGVVIAYSIFKYKLLDIVPIAYNKLFDKMGNGAIIIDSELDIVDLNQSAIDILQLNSYLVGKNVEEHIKQFKELYPLRKVPHESENEIKIDKPRRLWLDTLVTSLENNKQHIGWLITFSNITSRKKAEEKVYKSEKEYRDLVDSALVGVYKTDIDGNILFANDAMVKMLGYASKKELINFTTPEMYKNPDKRRRVLEKLIKDGFIDRCEIDLIKRNSEIITILLNCKLEGKVISGMILDITQKKMAEKQIKKSLEEKEMLLKEIHHRVKNNLMVISSLLSLQSRYIKDEASKNVFKESQNRARSMALIHELLYQSSDLKRINFGKFINTLTNELYNIYISNQNLIKLNVDVESVMLDINTSIPLGLIVNELVSNSMKHAFPEGRKGNINIKFSALDDNYTLVVEDDGVGFPKDLDLYNTDSLGLRLVNSLTEQIDGKLNMDNAKGSKFIIKFKEENYED